MKVVNYKGKLFNPSFYVVLRGLGLIGEKCLTSILIRLPLRNKTLTCLVTRYKALGPFVLLACVQLTLK